MKKLSITLLLSVFVLTACSFGAQNNVGRAAIDVNRYSFVGRVALSSEQGALQAKVDWEQDGERFSARVQGPFGLGASRMDGTPDVVTVMTFGQPVQTVRNPENYLAEQFGWHVPLDHVRFWLLGLSSPLAPASPLSATRQGIYDFIQDGWTVSYPEVGMQGQYSVPREILMQNGAHTMRWRIVRWNISHTMSDMH